VMPYRSYVFDAAPELVLYSSLEPPWFPHPAKASAAPDKTMTLNIFIFRFLIFTFLQ
jgi:hypothetical protein